MERNFILSYYGSVFSTREKGHLIGKQINDILMSMHKNETLVVSGKNVKAMSYSFVDELLAVLFSAENSNKRIRFLDWEEYLSQMINVSMSRRGLIRRNFNLNHKETVNLLV